ncbi:MAG: hypothetical protein AAF431_03780 [Pseudomonadota bacterium]
MKKRGRRASASSVAPVARSPSPPPPALSHQAPKRARAEPQRRKPSVRVRQRKEKEIAARRASFPGILTHFGVDVSAAVASGTAAGGKLSEIEREQTHKAIRDNVITGSTLDDVLPTPFVDQVRKTFSEGGMTQVDMRSAPSEGGAYTGAMFTSTFASPPEGGAEKEIPRPSSPRPAELASGLAHSGHTAPFSVGGEQTNQAKTVYVPQTANLVVDAHLEKRVIKAHESGMPAVHARLDTADRSTVFSVTKTAEGYSSTAAQYQRRDTSGTN